MTPTIPYQYRAECRGVVDGDTIDCDIDLGFYTTMALRFRLLGVDTPELRSKDETQRIAAKKAREFVIDCMFASDGPRALVVKTYKADSFGRWLAEIWFESEPGEEWKSLAAELLASGHAVEWKR